MENDKLILEPLLQILNFDNINKKHIDSYQKALIKDKAIDFIEYPTLALIINPQTHESVSIYSDEPHYEEEIQKALQNKYEIHYDNNNVGEIILEKNINSETIYNITHYKDIELPHVLNQETDTIISKIDVVLMETEPSKRGNFIDYLKGKIQHKLKEEKRLFDEFPVCRVPFERIEIYLQDTYGIYLEITPSDNTAPIHEEILSFKFLHSDEKILILYNLLSDANLIEADEQGFINAFSEQEVTVGIKWLSVAKRNKQTNKVSMCQQLI